MQFDNPGQRLCQGLFAPESATSRDKLLPIKRQVAATDRRIDRVVYHLYRLTEEEIAVGERKPG